MTCNKYVNIKEINNLQGANKLGPSLKKRKKETEGEGEQKIQLQTICIKFWVQGNAWLSPLFKNSLTLQAPPPHTIKNYCINSAKWTYCSYSFQGSLEHSKGTMIVAFSGTLAGEDPFQCLSSFLALLRREGGKEGGFNTSFCGSFLPPSPPPMQLHSCA